MSSLWFLVATTATFTSMRRMVAEGYPWQTISDQLDRWADALVYLAPDSQATAEALVLAALGIMIVDGPGGATIH